MENSFKTLLSTVALSIVLRGLLQDILPVQSIIVQRNLHVYYKLPIQLGEKTNKTNDTNDTNEFHILQCPHQGTADIPKPRDMPQCVIVGKYRTEIKTKGDLNQPKVSVKKSSQHIRKGRPYKVVKKKYMEIAQIHRNVTLSPKSRQQDKHFSSSSMKRPFIKQQHAKDQFIGSTAAQQFALNKSSDIPAQSNTGGQEQETYSSEYYNDYNMEDNSRTSAEELAALAAPAWKYLSLSEIIDKYSNADSAESSNPNDTALWEKYAAAEKKYRKGNKLKGYQNLYHRDEIHTDHTFYDELQQHGNYRNYGKNHKIY